MKHPASQLQAKGTGGFETYRFFPGAAIAVSVIGPNFAVNRIGSDNRGLPTAMKSSANHYENSPLTCLPVFLAAPHPSFSPQRESRALCPDQHGHANCPKRGATLRVWAGRLLTKTGLDSARGGNDGGFSDNRKPLCSLRRTLTPYFLNHTIWAPDEGRNTPF